ncbi:hypothetical protein GGI15_001337 [Coemansia interrupta]|uniref:Fungal-type protein kinase domain-containing protein n=1 Tax=Coemansia interrupta TaxID=1126814 RepID=A0A9W8LLH9_9FUNG|nr:hypothetical protein GGI15_001337 [Coemansia interrupta]
MDSATVTSLTAAASATTVNTTATATVTQAFTTDLDKAASGSFSDNDVEFGAFRVDVCGHQYSIPNDQQDAGQLDAWLRELTQAFEHDAQQASAAVAAHIAQTIEGLLAEQQRQPRRRRQSTRRRRSMASGDARRQAAIALARMGDGGAADECIDDLDAALTLVTHAVRTAAPQGRAREFRVARREDLGDGIVEFAVAEPSGEPAATLLGVAAPQSDFARPFSSGLAEFLVAAMNRHARRALSVRHAWALLLAPGRARLCLVESDAIHFTRALVLDAADARAHFGAMVGGLARSDAWRLGGDPSMRWRGDVDRWEIECPDDESDGDDDGAGVRPPRVVFAQREPLFTADAFFGRFTRCFAVAATPAGACDAVLKDSWQLAPGDGSASDEIAVLRRMRRRLDAARSACLYPRIVCGGTVRVAAAGGRQDASDLVLGAAAAYARWTVPHGGGDGTGLRRVHRRMVSGPVGVPLQTLASEHEVVAVLADAMRAHAETLRVAGVLHRDVSLNNVMAVRLASGELRGMLIDYDHAVDPAGARNTLRPGNVGTGPFMSIANLEGLDVARTAVDDWEALVSLLFCLAARSHTALDRMGALFAHVTAAGAAKRELFASRRALDAAIAEHLDAAACPAIVRLIRALYAAIFEHPKCQGTARMKLRSGRMVDPVLRRTQYAADIQARCLAAIEAAAADPSTATTLSDPPSLYAVYNVPVAARKRKANEETPQDSPSTKRRKMIHQHAHLATPATPATPVSDAEAFAEPLFATPRDPPLQAAHVSSKLKRKLF